MPLNILILGAGAIGSLFGAYLSTNHNTTLLCRTPHAQAINQKGLKITGFTNKTFTPKATDSITTLTENYDLVLLTVKAYDTQQLIQKIQPIQKNIKNILTLQNGLGNIETIASTIPHQKILAGITTHGAILTQPGIIKHTGIGRTIIGSLHPSTQKKTEQITQLFTSAGISTTQTQDIQKELWKKAIINSAINTLTTIFQCKNGYLLENPILKNILTRITIESTTIANTQNLNIKSTDMIQETIKVINETADNQSSMLQSIQQNQKTEIDYINGTLKTTAQQHQIPSPLNSTITNIIHNLTNNKE